MGTIGEQIRMDTTIISDTVNIASRIKLLTRLYDTPILISEKVLNNISNPDKYDVRFLDIVTIKQKSEPVKIYEVLNGLPKQVLKLKKETKSLFKQALSLYYQKDFKKSFSLLKQIIGKNPDDKAVLIYLKRCRDII
jgi:two-component system sensor histidine kinase ChiS